MFATKAGLDRTALYLLANAIQYAKRVAWDLDMSHASPVATMPIEIARAIAYAMISGSWMTVAYIQGSVIQSATDVQDREIVIVCHVSNTRIITLMDAVNAMSTTSSVTAHSIEANAIPLVPAVKD